MAENETGAEKDPFLDENAVEAPDHENVNADAPKSGTHSASPTKKTRKATAKKSVPDPLAEKTDEAATEAAAREVGSLHAANFTTDDETAPNEVWDEREEQTSESVLPETPKYTAAKQADQVTLEALPVSLAAASDDQKFRWVANVLRVRGKGRVAVDLRPQDWVGDSPLQLDLREVELVYELLGGVLARTEDLRG